MSSKPSHVQEDHQQEQQQQEDWVDVTNESAVRPKVSHIRSRTLDLAFSIFSSSSSSSSSLSPSTSRPSSPQGASSEHGTSQSGDVQEKKHSKKNERRSRFRRILSDTNVVSSQQREQQLEESEHSRAEGFGEVGGVKQQGGRGLAHLESQDYNQVLLTSEGEEDSVVSHSDDTILEGGDFVDTAVQRDSRDDGTEGEGSPQVGATANKHRKKKTHKKVTKKKKKSKRRKDNQTVHLPYYKDEKGELRDEYGFKVSEKDPHYLCTPGLHSKDKHTQVPHDAKKKILSRDALRKRQRQQWSELLLAVGSDLRNFPPSVFERWRKYYFAGGKSEESAEVYLSRISAPNPASPPAAFDPGSPTWNNPSSPGAEDGSSASSSKHRKQPSGASHSSTSSESPRRASRPFLSIGTMVRKMRSHKRGKSQIPLDSFQRTGEMESEHLRRASLDHIMLPSDSAATYLAQGNPASRPSSPRESPPSPRGQGSGSGTTSVGSTLSKQLTQTIRFVGVPPKLRRDVWLASSGALRKMETAGPNEQFEYLVQIATQEGNPPEMAEIIERDLHRTFPTNYHFEEEEGITRMRRVLLAYSLRNTAIGYCQSMNFLVAVLLLHMEENLAFWVLAAIVEDLVPGHYTKQMTGMHVDQRVFESLVKQRLPKIHAHLESINFPLEFVTYQWFLCLFVNSLSLEATLRIWDCFLHEGSKALFRSGLAILMILQKDILACCTFQDLYDCLSLSDNTDKKMLLSGDRIIKLAYDPISFMSFPSSKISQLRAMHLPVVLKNLGQQSEWEDFRQGKAVKTTSNAPTVASAAKSSPTNTPAIVEEQSFSGHAEGEENGSLSALKHSKDAYYEDDNDKHEGSKSPSSHTNGDRESGQLGYPKSMPSPSSASEATLQSDKLRILQLYHTEPDEVHVDRVHSSPERQDRSMTEADEQGLQTPEEKRPYPIYFRSHGSEFFSRTRRPSASFKYQNRYRESPMEAMSRLGVRVEPSPLRKSYRAASVSVDQPPSPESSSRSFDEHMPRRASTNTHFLTKNVQASFSDLLSFQLALENSRTKLRDEETKEESHTAQNSLETSVTSVDQHNDADDEGEEEEEVESIHLDDSQKDLQVTDDEEQEEEEEEEEEDDGSDIPSEFSGLLPSLVYVMSARQVDVEDPEILQRLSPRKAARESRSSPCQSQMQEKSSPITGGSRHDEASSSAGDEDSICETFSFSRGVDLFDTPGASAATAASPSSPPDGDDNDPHLSADKKIRRKRSFFSSLIGWSRK